MSASKFMALGAIVSASFGISACAGADDSQTGLKEGNANAFEAAPAADADEANPEFDVPLEKRVFVDPKTGYPEGMEPDDAEKTLSVTKSDQRSGSSAEEAGFNLPQNWVIRGVGARVASGGFKTLRIRATEHRADGQLGGPQDFYAGPEMGGGLEQYCEADGIVWSGRVYPAVVVGVGGYINSDDLKSLTVFYRAYDVASRTLFGAVVQKICGTGAMERLVSLPTNLPAGWNFDKTVANGVGFYENSDDLAGLRVRYRQISP